MNITLIIIVILAFALIVGPIRMMQPSKAQKNKEKMRLDARAHGVHYSLRNIPRQPDQQEAPIGMSVYFLPPVNANTNSWMLVRASYQHEINFLGWWTWQSERRPTTAELEVLTAQLPTLPDSVSAVSAGNEGICVFWNETGGEAVLAQVIKLLESLKLAVSED